MRSDAGSRARSASLRKIGVGYSPAMEASAVLGARGYRSGRRPALRASACAGGRLDSPGAPDRRTAARSLPLALLLGHTADAVQAVRAGRR